MPSALPNYVGTGKAVTVSGVTLAGGDSGNYTVAAPSGLSASITAATLYLTGVSAVGREYDATTRIVLDTAGAALSGVFAGDTVSLGTASGALVDKSAGPSKAVLVSATLAGADAGNYTVQAGGVTAAIAPKVVSVTGVAANDKVQDGTTAATLNEAAAAISGVVAGDAVTLETSGARGTFADADPGTGKAVTASGYALAGADAANYALRDPAGLVADITAAPAAPAGPAASLVGAVQEAIPQPTPPGLPQPPQDPDDERRRKSLPLVIVQGGVHMP